MAVTAVRNKMIFARSYFEYDSDFYITGNAHSNHPADFIETEFRGEYWQNDGSNAPMIRLDWKGGSTRNIYLVFLTGVKCEEGVVDILLKRNGVTPAAYTIENWDPFRGQACLLVLDSPITLNGSLDYLEIEFDVASNASVCRISSAIFVDISDSSDHIIQDQIARSPKFSLQALYQIDMEESEDGDAYSYERETKRWAMSWGYDKILYSDVMLFLGKLYYEYLSKTCLYIVDPSTDLKAASSGVWGKMISHIPTGEFWGGLRLSGKFVAREQ